MAKRQRRKRKGRGRGAAQDGDVQVPGTEETDAELLNLAVPELTPPEADDPVNGPVAQPAPEEAKPGSTAVEAGPDVEHLDASMAAWTSESPEKPDSGVDETASRVTTNADLAQSIEEHRAENDFEGSLPLLEAALLERPTDIDLLLLAGQTFTELGEHARAEVQFRAALELRPDDLPLQRELGFSLFRRGVYAEAAEALSVVCARSESDGEAYYYRGEAQNRSGQTEAAAETMEKAARLSPTDGRVFRSLGRIYDRLGMPEKAAENYGKARKTPSPNTGA